MLVCAQICTIANMLTANIMFAVEVLTFTHLRKKNLEKIEYRNTEFYCTNTPSGRISKYENRNKIVYFDIQILLSASFVEG